MKRTALVVLTLLLVAGGWWLVQKPGEGKAGEEAVIDDPSTLGSVPAKSGRTGQSPGARYQVSDDLKAILARLEKVAQAALTDPSPRPPGLMEILESMSAAQLKALILHLDFHKRMAEGSMVWRYREEYYRQWARLDPKGAHELALKVEPGEAFEDDPFFKSFLAVYAGWSEHDPAAAWKQLSEDKRTRNQEDHMFRPLWEAGALVMREFARQEPDRAWDLIRSSAHSKDVMEAFFTGVPGGQDWATFAATLEEWREEDTPNTHEIALAGRWSESDPEVAMAWAVQSDDGSFGGPDYIKAKVVHRWHGREPAQAARWLEKESAAGRTEVVKWFAAEMIDDAGVEDASRTVVPILHDTNQRADFLLWFAEWAPRAVSGEKPLSRDAIREIVTGSELAVPEKAELQEAIAKRFAENR